MEPETTPRTGFVEQMSFNFMAVVK